MQWQNWPFSELGWWIHAVYHIAGFTPPAGVPEVIDLGTSPYQTLDMINSCYENELEKISSSDMAENQARALLFGAKCFRKWRISRDASASSARAEKARLGFLQRNADAENVSYFGCSPTLRWLIRQELEHYLPLVEDRCTGKFGPGAVAEHLTHPKRFALLGQWCKLQSWDYNYPVGHAVMDHDCARLCAVPKQYDKDRLITVEPVYATFVQQYVRSRILESIHKGPLRGTCMDLGYTDGQAIQRRLALRASCNRELATLDLSDASDRITWDIVQDTFPKWVVDLLYVSRSSKFLIQEEGQSPKQHNLSIFAGMGNATTFPIETLFFTAYVRAVARLCGVKRPRVSVFGDDVICSVDVAMCLLEYESSYFRINSTKSFYRPTDRLRESCGIFAYQGSDITVPRIDGYTPSYEGELGVCDLVERLTYLGERYDLRFSVLAYHIVEAGRRWGMSNFPRKCEGYPSFHSWYNSFDAVPESRKNQHTQEIEYRVRVREPRRQFVSFSRTDNLTLGLYYGWFCGQVRTAEHRNSFGVYFPTGEYRFKKRWARTERGF